MPKIIAIIIAFALLISISSCGSDDTQLDYELNEECYKQGNNYSISYPSIKFQNEDKTTVINELLTSRIRAYFDVRLDGLDNFSIEVNYEITAQTKDKLSVLFLGNISIENAAHPSSVLFSINLDLENKLVLTINDFVKDVDDIADAILSGVNIEGQEDVLNYLRNEFTKADLIFELESADAGVGWYTYIENEFLGIAVLVPYVMGGYGLLTTSLTV